MAKFGELELIRESLVSVVNEMRANIVRASFSSIIYEGRDFSCALLTPDGRLLAQSLDDNPIHIFAVPYSANEIIRKYAAAISDGDAFLHNDPYSGGTHLNDILLIEPVFSEGELLAFTAVRSHWGDVGGMTAGSISGRATEIYQEGVRIPPIRIAEKGDVNDEILELLFANMRAPAERRGDFHAMLGASRKAADHLRRLKRRFGNASLVSGIRTLIANAEATMRRMIQACPDGEYCSEGYIDSNGQSNEPLVARLRLKIFGDRIYVNFFDASPQTAGPTNVGPVIALTSAGTITKAFLDPETPINQGSFQPITVETPVGSFINARPPVACGGSVEVKTLLDALIAGALGQAVPDKMVGDLKGSGNHIYISNGLTAAQLEQSYLFYEYPAGGTGATRRGDGTHAMRTYTEGDFNTISSAEVIESEMPLRVEQTSIRTGSHGHGAFRGGCGMTRDIRVLATNANLSVLSDKNIIPPYGVAGAYSGRGNSFLVFRDGHRVETSPIPGKISGFALQQGDLVRMQTAGGGGFGNPLEQNPRLVAEDVRLGYTLAEDASDVYGVSIDADGKVDEKNTGVKRTELFQKQTIVRIEITNHDEYCGSRRLLIVGKTLAKQLEVCDGALCELINPRGPGLRGWICIEERFQSTDCIPLGPFGREILRFTAGDTFAIRPITRAAY